MNPFNYAIIVSELFCVIICIILILANKYETHKKTEHGMIYSWMAFTNIIALVSDSISWIFEGNPDNYVVLFISSSLSIISAYVLLAQYALYISAYIKDRIRIPTYVLRTYLLFLSAAIIVTIFGCFTGSMFTIEDGIYKTNYLYDVYSVITMAALIMCLALVTKYRNVLGRHASIAVYAYIMFPTASAIMNLFIDNFTFTYQATTLSLLVLYVMLQSEQTDKLIEEGEISTYYANHDELTGILSRHAYTGKIDELASSDDDIGIMFSDINGLKYTNDNLGHKEGDKLIKKFAGMLKEYFKDCDLFRISGDEFIVIAQNMSMNEFLNKVGRMEDSINADDFPIACVGAVCGRSKEVEKLIQSAETIMYAKKEKFYKAHPEMNRDSTNVR